MVKSFEDVKLAAKDESEDAGSTRLSLTDGDGNISYSGPKVNAKLVNVREFESEARKRISKDAWGFYRSGANYEHTLKENESAFNRLRIRPRFFNQDVSHRNLRTKVLGTEVTFPIGVAPTAMQRMANPIGEIGTAKGKYWL